MIVEHQYNMGSFQNEIKIVENLKIIKLFMLK